MKVKLKEARWRDEPIRRFLKTYRKTLDSCYRLDDGCYALWYVVVNSEKSHGFWKIRGLKETFEKYGG